MAQPDFTNPDFIDNNSADEIHQRMMDNLPEDIDDMPGGFPYDFTKPAALQLDEFINYHLVRALQIAFPMYAWDEWLDLHGEMVGLTRNAAGYASGYVLVTGTVDAEISEGTIFCTAATDTSSSIQFKTTEDAVIGEDGTVEIPVKAVEAGTNSNVAANTVVLMYVTDKNITEVTNPEAITGGTATETNDDFYDRISAEYDSSLTYVGNDADYIRWAKEAGAGDCIVIPAWDGPGTVKLALIDSNGDPANDDLCEAVYDYIVSEDDRSARLLPTACAELTVEAAESLIVNYTVTGLEYDDTTDIDTIASDFASAVDDVYEEAMSDGVLRYNDVRPLLSAIAGVIDFDTFLMNDGTDNIELDEDECPVTGTLSFS